MKKIDGQPVVNARKRVTFVVRDADIKKAARKSNPGCVAAIACMRDLKATAAQVHTGRTYLNIDGKWTRFKTPGRLRSEIIAFDRGGEFEAGEYTLDLPPKIEEGPRGPRGTLPKRGTRRPIHLVGGIRQNGKYNS